MENHTSLSKDKLSQKTLPNPQYKCFWRIKYITEIRVSCWNRKEQRQEKRWYKLF